MTTARFWIFCVIGAIVANLLAVCAGYGISTTVGVEKVIMFPGCILLAFLFIGMLSAIHSEIERVNEKIGGMTVPLFAKIMVFGFSLYFLLPIHLVTLGSQWATGS
jgi:hypothetical protein